MGPELPVGAAQVTQPLTPVTSPLLDSQEVHVLPERSVQRDGAQTRCTVPQVGLREAGGSQSGTARCGGGSGDRRPSRQPQRTVWGLSQAGCQMTRRVMQGHCERCVRECISVQAAWLVMAAGDCHPMDRGATQSSLCCVEVCTLAALCTRKRVGMTALMYAAEANAADMCRVLVAAEAGSVRKDGKTALILAAVATKRRRPCLGCLRKGGRPARHQWLYCSDGGCAAQRHRSASLTEEEPASREAPQQHIAASSKMLPWSRCYIPTRSCSSRWRAAHVMPSAVLRRAVSEDRGGTRARQGPGLRACTHLLLHPMQDSSTIRHSCEQLLTLTIRATGDRLVDCPRPARHSALETFTIRVTPCPCRRTTSRESRRGRPRRPRRRRCLRSRPC